MFDLSIIIVNWNTKGHLQKCLDSIYNNTKDLVFEIIVIDNDSSDDSVKMVKDSFPQVNLIVNQKNVGFAAANNQAIRKSSGEYILLLNPDTIVMPNSIKIMFNFIKSNSDIGIVGPKILGSDGKIQLTCARNFPTLPRIFFDISTLSKRFPKSRIFGSYSMGYWDHNDEREIDSILGACMLIRRKMLDKIGLLDENFFMYAEDTDLCMRAKKANWKIWYLPKAQIVHFGGQSSRIDIENMTIESQESMYKFFKKHRGIIYAHLFRILIAFSLLFWNLLWFLCYFFRIEKGRAKIQYIFKRNNEIVKWAIKGRRHN